MLQEVPMSRYKKRSGTPVGFISESLDHNSLQTTEAYQDSFEDENRSMQIKKALTNFTL
jgi:hypothetical protein